MNKLAIITGASAGIGAEFARQLAQQGYDLLLVARRVERLEALANELRNGFGISAEIRATDLANPEQTQQLANHIKTLNNIALLINNAGFGIEIPIADAPVDGQLAMMHVHMTAPYLLCQAVLPGMIAQRSGGIINVSSIAAWMHGPGAANYCATKAYLSSFSKSLALEVAGHNVKVQALCPGYTVTEFHDTESMDGFDRGDVPGKLWDSAEFVVKTSLDALNGGKVIVIPGRKNQLLVASSGNGILTKARKVAKKLLRRG